MSDQNIRHTEKYLIIQTMFNDLLRSFQQSENTKSDQIFKKSEFYSESLSMFETSGSDISLLIFAIPGLVIRHQFTEVITIYEQIHNIITSKWDVYQPNHLSEQDYLFFRIQDIHRLDKLVYMLTEFVPINIGDDLYLKTLTSTLDSNITFTLESEEHTVERAAEVVGKIISSINKINMFLNKIMISIDDEDIKNSYQESVTTVQLLDKPNQVLTEILQNIHIRRQNSNKIQDNQDDEQSTSSNDEKLRKIIKLIKSLENKHNDHILILALKYAVKNFHINNKLMMQRMLSDASYANVVDIILKDEDKPKV